MSTTATKVRKARQTFRRGDRLDESIYAEGNILLLASGQRIDSPAQLKMLEEAGFEVDFKTPAKEAAPAPVSKTQADPGLRAQEEFDERVRHAKRVRQGVKKATAELLARVNAGQKPDVDHLLPVASNLAADVTRDPYAIASITHLSQCDDYTLEHSVDVAILMVAIARLLGFPEEEHKLIVLAGMMHDVGKQKVPPEVLHKPGRLTDEEFQEIRRHPEYGYEILKQSEDCPEEVRLVALQHHERCDGQGYPQGLTAEQITPYSRISCVADTFDAMTADRVYKKGASAWYALSELHVRCKEQYDNQAVMALTKLVGVFPVGTRVKLDSGEIGDVVAPNPADSSRPMVRVDRDRHGHPLPYPFNLDLSKSPRHIVGAQK